MSDAASSRPGGGRLAVLVVDDEHLVRNLLVHVLTAHGLTVFTAAGGKEALEVYRRHADEIGVVLLDVQMPGVDGPETLRLLRELNPGLPCCFMSGHLGSYTAESLLALGAACIFPKPFPLEELDQGLRRAAGRERRNDRRTPASQEKVLIRPAVPDDPAGDAPAGAWEGRVRDRSPHGLGVLAGHEVRVGARLHLSPEGNPSPDPGDPLEVEVMHCSPHQGEWKIGCRILPPRAAS